jgi:hypothetical protein
VDLIGDFDVVEDIVNTFQFRLDSASLTDDAQVLDDLISLLESIVTIMKNLATAITVWRRIRVQNISNNTLIGERAFTAPIAGLVSGNPAPPGVAALLSLKTNIPRVVMRKYIGVLPQSTITATGVIAAASVTHLNNLGNFLMSSQIKTNGTWSYGYLSPKTAGFVRPVSFLSSSVPAYQRRRRQGRGS